MSSYVMLAYALTSQVHAGYWHLLFTWADFLSASLPDPGKQLCTDDFEAVWEHILISYTH